MNPTTMQQSSDSGIASADGPELLEKLFQLPTVAGAEVPVFSTSRALAGLDVYFDARGGVSGGKDPTIGVFEYVFKIYAVTGSVRKEIAQGRFTDTKFHSLSAGRICSARSMADRFDVTCLCVRATSGQVAISGYGYGGNPSGDPDRVGGPGGYIVSRAFSGGADHGTFTAADASVSQFYGYSTSTGIVFVRLVDGHGVLAEFVVPGEENFSMTFDPPIFFEGSVSWVASASPLGPPLGGPKVACYAQYR